MSFPCSLSYRILVLLCFARGHKLARTDNVPLLPHQAAQGGGHRTLLYGHAILLRHSFSGMVSTSGCSLSPFKEVGKDKERGEYRKPARV